MLNTAAVAELEAAAPGLDLLTDAEIEATSAAFDALADALSQPANRFTPTRRVTWAESGEDEDTGPWIVMSDLNTNDLLNFWQDSATGMWTLIATWGRQLGGITLGLADTLLSLVNSVLAELGAQAGA
jgi:hypothetical protein